MGEQTIKIGTETYDRIKKLSKVSGQSLRETTDLILNEKLDKLSELGEKLGTLEIAPVQGAFYQCEDCGRILDQGKNPETCPGCGKALDWESRSVNPGMLGWTAVGILALMLLTRTRTL